ncbi:MAG: monovalent cation/H+ antiporter complex subunit F [Candidatus Hydrogenedentales bacterium]
MHSIVFYTAIVWQLVLAAVLAAYMLRARDIVTRALVMDVLSLVTVAAVAIVGIRRNEPGYLDVALVLGMLSFVQTVAAARLAEKRKEFR